MLTFYASEPHYLDHLVPIYAALESDERGLFHIGARLGSHSRHRGIPPTSIRIGRPRQPVGLIVVASYRDLRQFSGHPCILVEHGSGQSYGDRHPSYSGGRDRHNVVLFVVPNEAAALRNRAVYPDTPYVVAGSPRLDRWIGTRTPGRRQDGPAATVAVSFHWDYQHGSPEGRWAFPHFAPALGNLRDGPWHLIGHGHPRAWRTLRRYYDQLGIEPVEDFEKVLERADLYACDNSSTLFEFAATDRPVVVMNAPWYRREVEHGLRFWSCADVGLQVDEPGDLVATVARALTDPSEAAHSRQRVVMQTYPVLNGRSSERAAEAIRQVAEEVRCRIPRRRAG